MVLAPGSRLGSYEITAAIGSGGMGEVYRATDTKLKRQVAIKILPAFVAADRDRLARFQREAEVLAALNHPHICTLFDVGADYLVMEYLEGTPLQGPLPEGEALRLALQTADALDTAHGQGIVHRDLKPANILVTRFGVKLLDFGLATHRPPPGDEGEASTMTTAGTLLGTAAYMSPEQARGQQADFRSDVFSFGVVLYELLSGRRAFPGETMVAVLADVIHKEPERLQASPALVQVVERCLRKSPEDRYQRMADVRRDLAKIDGAREAAPPSIAVLPFANLSADKENEYFSDGLAEEILNGLAQLPGLRVVARASAFAFRGREHDVGAIAETLGVNSVLQGSVRRAGNRIRIAAQLIDVRDASQLWSERYDREMRDVFDIQDEIAQAIVDRLKVQLGTRGAGPLVKRYTENLEAHSLYLKGNFHLYRLQADDMEKGREYLERAVALEPGHAPAWVQLGDYYIAGAFVGRAPARVLWPKAKEASQHAVSADAAFAEGHAAMGFVTAVGEYRWADALQHLATAMRLNPSSARTHFWCAQVEMAMGRSQESLESAVRAVALDPLFLLYRYGHSKRLIHRHAYAAAADQARQALEIDPHYTLAALALARAYSRMGRHEDAIALMEAQTHAMHRHHYDMGYLTWVHVAVGRRGEAEAFLAGLEAERRTSHVPASTLALAALGLGDHARALGWLEGSVDEFDPNLINVVADPCFEPLHADPRYQTLLRRMNLA